MRKSMVSYYHSVPHVYKIKIVFLFLRSDQKQQRWVRFRIPYTPLETTAVVIPLWFSLTYASLYKCHFHWWKTNLLLLLPFYMLQSWDKYKKRKQMLEMLEVLQLLYFIGETQQSFVFMIFQNLLLLFHKHYIL